MYDLSFCHEDKKRKEDITRQGISCRKQLGTTCADFGLSHYHFKNKLVAWLQRDVQ
jgi:hypothetical protein